MTRSNITWFCIWYNNDRGKIYITGYIHENTSYLTLTVELWGVFRKDLGENWPQYKGTALYLQSNRAKIVHSSLLLTTELSIFPRIYLQLFV